MSRSPKLVAGMLAVGASWSLSPALPAEAAVRHKAFGARTLEKGDRGRDVRILQDFLSRAGVGTTVDGHFGPATRRSLRRWERRRAESAAASAGTATASRGLRVDGRLTRREAGMLRSDVALAESGGAPPGAPEEPPAPPAPGPGEKATLAPDGTAVAPESAPEVVKQIIAAGNRIHDLPYRYGGGHRSDFRDSAYDCSG
ncbi:MAG TPA: peptidoglycan-binding protein, partial [Solirubrobacteraceae bacterium]